MPNTNGMKRKRIILSRGKTNCVHAAKYYQLINELYEEGNVMYIKRSGIANAFILIKTTLNA